MEQIEKFNSSIQNLKIKQGTSIFRACDVCDEVAKEFSSKFYQSVAIDIHLFTDAEDNSNSDETILKKH